MVTPAKNLWHCFGCGAAGGPIDWIMKKHGVSFRHAVELLREGILSLAASDAGAAGPVKRFTVRALAMPVEREADDVALLNQVAAYYHETLQQSPAALAYLAARGIDHPDAIEYFRLGHANRLAPSAKGSPCSTAICIGHGAAPNRIGLFEDRNSRPPRFAR